LENKRAEQVLPESEAGRVVGRRVGSKGQWGEVTQTMYIHMKKYKNNNKNVFFAGEINNISVFEKQLEKGTYSRIRMV
jgi:hypothetical protein